MLSGPIGAARSFHALGGHGLFMPIHLGLFDLALHHWTQPIESIFAVDGLKLWSPAPGIPSEVVPGIQIRSDWWRERNVLGSPRDKKKPQNGITSRSDTSRSDTIQPEVGRSDRSR